MAKLIDARDLLTYNRLDLMAKYTYVEHKLNKYDMKWAKELYSKHIEAFSGGSFREPGNSEKKSLDTYFECFDQLIEDIQYNGIDTKKGSIPISPKQCILDGAHRTSIAAYLGLELPYIVEERTCNYDYFFFKKMHLDDKYLDYMVTRYIELSSKECYVICLWPKAMSNIDLVKKTDEVIYLSSVGVVASKVIDINYKGLHNFMIHCYSHYPWCGDYKSHFKGIEGKVDPCYDSCKKMKVYVVEVSNVEEVLTLKSDIRNIFGMGNHSVHSSDNVRETDLMIRMLFNANSLHLLNNGDIDYDSDLIQKVEDFKARVSNAGNSITDFVIDSSSILGLYGIRKVRDLDYLSLNGLMIPGEEYDNHLSYLSYYDTTVDDLILNPLKHTYAFGVKFINLETLKTFKKNRNSTKDREDIKLIEQKERNDFKLNVYLECSKIKIKRTLRNYKSKVRMFFEDHNIFFFTKIWHFVRGKGFN